MENSGAETKNVRELLVSFRNVWGEVMYVVVTAGIRPIRHHLGLAVVTFLFIFSVFVFQAIRTGYAYSSTASLILSPPAYLAEGLLSETGPSLMPKPFDIPSYARLLKGSDIFNAVCERVYNENPELWEKEYEAGELVPENLAKALYITTEVASKTPQAVIYSRVIRLTARGKEPEKIKALLDAWVIEAIAAARSFSQPSSQVTIDFIRSEYEKTRGELEAIEDDLLAIQSEYDVVFLDELETVKEIRLQEGTMQLYVAREHIAQLTMILEESQIALDSEDEKIVFRYHPGSDALAVIDAMSDGDESNVDTPIWITEESNPVYTTLQNEHYAYKKRLVEAQSRVKHLETELTNLEQELKTDHKLVVEVALREKRLMRAIETRSEYFKSLALRREEVAALEGNAKLAEASAIVIANRPILPQKPTNSITRWGSIPVGFIVALVAAIALVNLVYEFRRVSQSLEDRSEDEAEPNP